MVFSYPIEEEKDWEEFADLLEAMGEYRKKIRPSFNESGESIYKKVRKGEKIKDALMFQIAPTPFVPEPGTPFEFIGTNYTESDKQDIEELVHRKQEKYSFIKMEGLNGVATHKVETLLNRGGKELQRPLENWFKDNGYKIFGNSLSSKFLIYLKSEGIDTDSYFKEINHSNHGEINFRIPEEKREIIYKKALNKFYENYECTDWGVKTQQLQPE